VTGFEGEDALGAVGVVAVLDVCMESALLTTNSAIGRKWHSTGLR
jgi:hypothetical protein